MTDPRLYALADTARGRRLLHIADMPLGSWDADDTAAVRRRTTVVWATAHPNVSYPEAGLVADELADAVACWHRVHDEADYPDWRLRDADEAILHTLAKLLTGARPCRTCLDRAVSISMLRPAVSDGLCPAHVGRQTVRPRRIVRVDR